MKKIKFSCTLGYYVSILVMGWLSVKDHTGLSNNEKLLKWPISAVLLPGKDGLVFDDTYSAVDCARMVMFFWIVLPPYASIQLAFPMLPCKANPSLWKSLSGLRGPPTCWLSSIHSSVMLWGEHSHPHPRHCGWPSLSYPNWEKQEGQFTACGCHMQRTDGWVGGGALAILPIMMMDNPPHTTRISHSLSWKVGSWQMISNQWLCLLQGMPSDKCFTSQCSFWAPPFVSPFLFLFILFRNM